MLKDRERNNLVTPPAPQKDEGPIGRDVHFQCKQTNLDHKLFLNKRGAHITCFIIYVDDDMIITRNDIEEMSQLTRKLFKEFEIKDLGN